MAAEKTEKITINLGLVDLGQIRVAVSAAVPLTEAPRAHAALEARHGRGKIVLEAPGQ